MSVIKNTFKFAAGVSWTFTRSLVGFILFGLILNIILFFLLPDRCDLKGAEFSYLASNCLGALLIMLLFLPLFPILYGLLGYKYAIQKTLQFGYVKNRRFFYEYLMQRFMVFVNKYSGGNLAGAASLADRFFDRLEGLPFVLKTIVRTVKKFVPIADIVARVSMQDNNINEQNKEEVALKIADEADRYLKDELLQPDMTLPYLLVGINLGMFALFKWVL